MSPTSCAHLVLLQQNKRLLQSSFQKRSEKSKGRARR